MAAALRCGCRRASAAGPVTRDRYGAETRRGYGGRVSPARRLTIAAASLLAGVTALAPTAHARIAVNRSIAGIGLGMTAAEVRAKLGRPTLDTVRDGARNLVYRRRLLVVTLVRGRVVIVSTRSRRQRTRSGIGVGTSADVVRARLRGVRCGVKAGVGFCRVGSVRSGRRSTTLQVEDGSVVTVTIARGLG